MISVRSPWRPAFRVLRGGLIAIGASTGLAAFEGAPSWRNPVPDAQLRSLTSDRPDATESPYTVDAGHLQIEASFAAYTRADAGENEWNFAPVNIRVGIRSNFELQFVLDGYRRTRSETGTGPAQIRSGVGDVTVRAKFNLHGNDGGSAAWAVMPFVKLPTNSGGVGNRSVEGGMLVPVAFPLGSWSAGAMTQLDLMRNTSGDSFAIAWTNTFTVGHGVTQKMAAFFELASTAGAGGHALGFNTGLTYAVHENFQLDGGVNLGLSRTAPDVVIFFGLTSRY